MLLHYLVKLIVQIHCKLQQKKSKSVSHLTKMKRLCCHMVEWTQAYCFLQQILEVSAICLHTCTNTLAPLVNCIVNDALVDVTPHLLQTLFQFDNVVHP